MMNIPVEHCKLSLNIGSEWMCSIACSVMHHQFDDAMNLFV